MSVLCLCVCLPLQPLDRSSPNLRSTRFGSPSKSTITLHAFRVVHVAVDVDAGEAIPAEDGPFALADKAFVAADEAFVAADEGRKDRRGRTDRPDVPGSRERPLATGG